MVKDESDIADQLTEGCHRLGISIDSKGVSALVNYYSELIRWGKKVNLVGKKQSATQIIENHFIDSLVLLRYLQGEDCSLVDVGSGAGFPGLACKAVLPKLKLVLVEPRLKRVSFLLHVVRTLGLSGVEVIAKRVEEADPESMRGSYITSRAVAEISEFLQMVHGVVADNTKILCMKGPKWHEELSRASTCLAELQFSLIRTDEFILPFSDAKRFVLMFQRSKA